MADYRYWYLCESCDNEISHDKYCLDCKKKIEHEEELNRLRPFIKEVLKEEGLIDRLGYWRENG